jgi:hypothetical protein
LTSSSLNGLIMASIFFILPLCDDFHGIVNPMSSGSPGS